ncbi:hypothetical protein M5K25_009292 [Dendrobium thyrsiflorum]|uniref:Uncharacterized protein n=1 Tax=Dendrobium thyrsiflorum TaxID=117978 RepID=A0ABD0V564_DENTH
MEADDIDMEIAAEVEMGIFGGTAAASSSSFSAASTSSKRIAIKNTIQTNFHEDYISTLAVSLSSNTIKLYSPATGQFLGECKGHISTIHEISFAVPSSPHLLCSCSSDATVRMRDTRTFKQILFWDLRSSKQVACLEESHMDDVTQERFTPNQQNKLISSSVDGLLCHFDTVGHIDDDNHLESVMNVGTSVGKFGFFGEKNQKLWCLTHIETLRYLRLAD